MKTKIIVVLAIIVCGIICCNKEDSDNYKSHGTITGADIRMCACCGGWYILIDTETYEFNSLPDNSDIDLEKEIFPLKVKLDWQPSNLTGCPLGKIIIQRIKKE